MSYQKSKLRDYQYEALYKIESSRAEGLKKVAVVMATGLGKTVVLASYIAEWDFARQGRVLVLCHREKLCLQIVDAIKSYAPKAQVGLEQGMSQSTAYDDVVVGTVQSVSRRLTSFLPSEFGLIIVDEAHHNSSKSTMYNSVMRHFYQAYSVHQPFMINFTATYFRNDGVGFHDRCEKIIYEYTLMDAVRDGYLVKPVPYVVGVKDLKFESQFENITSDDIDKALTDDQKKMVELVGKIVSFCKGRKTLIFVDSQKMCEVMTVMINQHPTSGGKAMFVHGNLHKEMKKEFFEKVASGAVDYAVGCDMLIEGFDWPECEVIVVAKPIGKKSKARIIQIAGRGTRPHPSVARKLSELSKEERLAAIANSPKPVVPVLDLVAFSATHTFTTTSSLEGIVVNQEMHNEIAKIAAEMREPAPMDEIIKAAEESLKKKKEEEEKKKQGEIKKTFGFYAKACLDISEAEDIPKNVLQEEISKVEDPPTVKQINWLKRNGLFDVGMTKKKAMSIMNAFMADRMPSWLVDILKTRMPKVDWGNSRMNYFQGYAVMRVMRSRGWHGSIPSINRGSVGIRRDRVDQKYRVFIRDFGNQQMPGNLVMVFGPYIVGNVAKKVARRLCGEI